MKVVIYKDINSKLGILYPNLGCGLNISEVIAKDLPIGTKYVIADASVVPIDREDRELWDISDSLLTEVVL